MTERECPKCKEQMIYMDNKIDIETKIGWTKFKCNNCNCIEKDYYKFSHTIEDK